MSVFLPPEEIFSSAELMEHRDLFAGLESYSYIRENPDKPGKALQTVYKSPRDLRGKMVVQHEVTRRFIVFKNPEEYFKFQDELPPEQRSFHEVIFEGPQKHRFDIDAPASASMGGAELIDPLLDAIYLQFQLTYMEELTPEKLLVYESERPRADSKYSYHVIVDGYFAPTSAECAKFAADVITVMGKPLVGRFIDRSVYKSLQQLRIVGCSKSGESRAKKWSPLNGRPEPPRVNSLIGYIGNCEQLPELCDPKPERMNISVEPHYIQEALAQCESSGILNSFRFTRAVGNMLVFQRVHPSYCEVCKRQHDTDNTLRVSILQGNSVYNVFWWCIRNPKQMMLLKSYPRGETSSAEAQICLQRRISRGVQNAPFAEDVGGYTEPKMRPFELVPTLIVHAPMKIGKTKTLADYLAKHYPDTLEHAPVIRFLTFRQTFASSIKERFPEFTLYSEVSGRLLHSRLIVQIESLHRLEIVAGMEPPDLLIMDESESILEQFGAGLLGGNFHMAFAVFKYLVKFSKRVICMDAYITERTREVLKRLRPEFPAHYHLNKHPQAKGDHYFITSSGLRWTAMLLEIVSTGRVAVPMSSLREAKTVYRLLVSRYPDKRIKLYSRETPPSEKVKHFSNVNYFWSQYDVLIYTPTVSAGVSFEVLHYDYVFGYFVDSSCGVETCIQMLGRIRRTTYSQYVLYLDGPGNTLPADIDSIRDALYSRRLQLFDEIPPDTIEFARDGTIIRHESEYTLLWLHNTRIKHLSVNDFISRFSMYLARAGAQVEALDSETFEEFAGYPPEDETGATAPQLIHLANEKRNTEQGIAMEIIEKILEAPEIDGEQADRISTEMRAQKDISERDQFAYKKYKLRQFYKWEGPISQKFLKTYMPDYVQTAYRNLQRIYQGGTVSASLRLIKEQEREYIEKYSDMYEINDRDMLYNHVYDKHYSVISVLGLCGWNSLMDARVIHAVNIRDNIVRDPNGFWTVFTQMCQTLRLRIPPITATPNIDLVIKKLNKALGIMYLMRVKSVRGISDTFSLVPQNTFNHGQHTPTMVGLYPKASEGEAENPPGAV